MFKNRVKLFVALFAAMTGLPAPGSAQPTFTKEIYQDFRGKKPLIDQLKFVGPDHDETITPEDEGLRINLPKTRKANQPTGVRLMVPLHGDFEITAKYEVLFLEKPPAGLGVGVGFNLGAQEDLRKMAKFGRYHLPKQGNVYVAETWNKDKPVDKPYFSAPTIANLGQLRVIREGTKVRYLVADQPADRFREISSSEFTDDDLQMVRLAANTNGRPAAVDVRLLDLRLRYGVAAPGAAPPAPAPAAEVEAAPPKRWILLLVFIIGFGFLLVLASGLGGWLYLRRPK